MIFKNYFLLHIKLIKNLKAILVKFSIYILYSMGALIKEHSYLHRMPQTRASYNVCQFSKYLKIDVNIRTRITDT